MHKSKKGEMMGRTVRAIFEVILFLSLAFGGNALSAESKFVKKSGSDSVIVFVHGVMGDASSTWKNGSFFWPDEISKDDVFNSSDVFVFNYPTSMWGTMSIDELSENMRLVIDSNDILAYKHIIFIAHSMGGIVTRAFLLNRRDVASKTKFMYFFSTPSEGSQVANLALIITNNPQIDGMVQFASDKYLADLQRHWLNADFGIPTYCAYEKRKTLGIAIVVMQSSAAALCTKRLDPIDEDHASIVKPSSRDSVPYLAFRSAYKEAMNIRSRATDDELLRQFREIIFTLNKTQIEKGETFDPNMTNYMNQPTEENWKIVQANARDLFDKIKLAIDKSRDYDAQFIDYADKIVILTGQGREIANRNYAHQFRFVRQEWQARGNIFGRIIDRGNPPSVEEVRQWGNELKVIYASLAREMIRLVALIEDDI